MVYATSGRRRSRGAPAVAIARSFFGAVLALAALALAALAGCAKLPPGKSAVDEVTVEGGDDVDPDDAAEKIATAPSPRFLGLFQGVVYDYEVYDERVLARDLERLERYYRARGHYAAKVRAARVERTGERSVRVSIEVDEGPAFLVRAVHVEGLEALSPAAAAAVRRAVRREVKEGEAFDEDAFNRAAGVLEWSLKNHSYALARVEKDAAVDVVAQRVDVTFQTAPGPPARVTGVRFEGHGDLPEEKLRTLFNVRPGSVYSEDAIDEGRQALIELGVFSDVDVRPGLERAPEGARSVDLPLVVKVSRARLRTVRLGGGAELDSLRAEVHALGRWEHRNFFGGLRNFRVELQPALVLYPTRVPGLEAPNAFLPAEQARVELRQPGFFEARTGAKARLEANTYPVILRQESIPGEPILGYFELRAMAGVERPFFKRFWAGVGHGAQFARPFAYRGAIDERLTDIIVSYPELTLRYDGRDDILRTKRGFYLSTVLQAAGAGGDARDVRVQPEARAYVPVGRGRRFVLATRANAGFVSPFNYAKDIPRDGGTGVLAPSPLDAQLLFFRGFFSGGPNSNRGYPLRGVGPHGSIPFFNPQASTSQIANDCDVSSAGVGRAYDERCLVPIGGLSLWELTVEGRAYLSGPLAAVLFCDASDVSLQRFSLRFDRPHLSCGLGGRYDTPVGPVRLDVAYRLPGLQTLGGSDRRDEREPPTLLGLPIALQVGIGEAF
ncbi:MAG TPA: POTRA domain-containing protein [Polyangiaceae bacterium]|nr:POTRA domain-containing protein [Polyangiaceae bacterium]